jgi:TIR domain
MADSGARKYDVFISYAHTDREFSEYLAKALRNLDLSVWFDLWSIKPGERWQDTIEHALDTETALFVIGPDGIEKWQSAALQATLVKSIENPDVRIVPVLAPGSKRETIPRALRSFRALDLRKWDKGEFQNLVDILKKRPRRHEPAIPPPKVPVSC